MHTSFAALNVAALVGVCISAVHVHAFADLETVALQRALRQYEPQLLGSAGPYISTHWSSTLSSSHEEVDEYVLSDVGPVLREHQGSGALSARRKMLQITDAVLDPSPTNQTSMTEDLTIRCPEIARGPALCATGPWAIDGGALVRTCSSSLSPACSRLRVPATTLPSASTNGAPPASARCM